MLLEYQDIFIKELDPKQHFNDSPMNMNLPTDYAFFMFGRHRATPIHWREQIDRDHDKLMREGVIAKWTKDEPPRYLSPAHFMEKRRKPGDPLKLRIVVDLRVLNLNVRWLGTSIPTSLKIRKQIKPTSKFFCCKN